MAPDPDQQPDQQLDDQAVPALDPEFDPDGHHVGERADLLPEEEQAGSDDPVAQAEAILEDSAERTEFPEETEEDSPQV